MCMCFISSIVLFQPLVEAFCDHNAPLPLLHRVPHAAVLYQAVVAAVDSAHLAAVVGRSLGPERDQTPFRRLELVLRFCGCETVNRTRCGV